MQGALGLLGQTGVYVAELESVPSARRFAVDAAQNSGWKYSDSLAQVIGELAANAAQYGASSFVVQVFPPYETVSGRFIEVEVADDSPLSLVKPEELVPETSECGRGLFLVKKLAESWYWGRRDTGKFVRVTLREEKPK